MADKKVLWRVPIYLIIAGLITFRLNIFLFSKFAVSKLPDGTIVSNETAVTVIYWLVLIGTLFIGGIAFFRNMTRKEIFLSSSIIVVLDIIILFAQWAMQINSGSMAVLFMYFAEINEWSMAIPLLLMKVVDNLWICSFVGCLAPYLFIPFGKKL